MISQPRIFTSSPLNSQHKQIHELLCGGKERSRKGRAGTKSEREGKYQKTKLENKCSPNKTKQNKLKNILVAPCISNEEQTEGQPKDQKANSNIINHTTPLGISKHILI